MFALLALLLAGCSPPEEVISREITRANRKLEISEVGAAVGILEKLMAEYPDKPSVQEALGFAYAQAANHSGAARALSKAADLDPASSSLRQFAAEAYLRDGNPARAAEQHRLYLAENPGDLQSRQKLGEIEESQGNYAQAIEAYLECYHIQPDGATAWRIGNAFRRLDNQPQARSWFEQTLKHADSSVDKALVGLLAIERESQDYGSVERTFGLIQRNFPEALDPSESAAIRGEIADWKDREGNLAAVRAEQEKIAREFEDDTRRKREELRNPPPTAAATGRPPSTEPSIRVVDTVGTTPAPLPRGPATITPPPAAPPPADAPAPAAIALPPELVAAIEAKNAGAPDKAAEILSTLLASDDSHLDLWTELADCYRQLKQYAAAEAYILEARRRAPDSIEIETAFLNIVRESQSADIYLTRLEQARTRFPENVSLAHRLATELATTGASPALVASAFEEFLLIAPPDDPRRAEAARALARTRRP